MSYCMKMGDSVGHINVSPINCDGQSDKTVSLKPQLLKRQEKRNGNELRSVCFNSLGPHSLTSCVFWIYRLTAKPNRLTRWCPSSQYTCITFAQVTGQGLPRPQTTERLPSFPTIQSISVRSGIGETLPHVRPYSCMFLQSVGLAVLQAESENQ